MAIHVPTDWFPEHLQNELTPGAVALMRAWLAEACRINGTDFSAQGLLDSLAAYVAAGMEDKYLGTAPRDSPPLEQLAAELAAQFARPVSAAGEGS
jgi:hypothetical protein